MNRSVIRYLFPLLILFGVVHGALAQTAQFSGQVSDPHQAMVSGAQIRVVNQSTGVKYEVNTNNDGAYVVPFVSPGSYRIYVKSQGFNIAVSEPLTVTVGQEMIFDVQLKVGSEKQEITVYGGTQMMNTTDGSVSTVIDQQFVKDMPLNGRSLQDLISMTPGVITSTPQESSAVAITGDFSVNGQHTESNGYFVDGVSANFSSAYSVYGGIVATTTVSGTTQGLLSVDALQEFRVESSSYSAEYGRFPGGQFSFASKSGTNNYHGTASEYLRNNFTDANDWFNDYYGYKQSPLRQNDFGGIFGGPVQIPKLYNGKGKAFFFISYEGLRLTLPQPATEEYVPTLAVRQASDAFMQPLLNAFPQPNMRNSGGQLIADQPVTCSTINGTTGANDGSNTIGWYNGYPCPGGVAGTLVPSGMAPFALPYSLPNNIDSYSGRLDYNLTSKMSAFFRIAYTPSWNGARSGYLSMDELTHSNTATYTAGVTNQLSDRINNSFRLGYGRNSYYQSGIIDSFGGATPTNIPADYGIDKYPRPKFEVSTGVTGVGTSYLSDTVNSDWAHQFNVVDTVSMSHGRHQFKFGFDYRRVLSPAEGYDPYAYLFFANSWQMENNDPSNAGIVAFNPGMPIYNQIALFAQDEWRAASRLSVSIGLRWDVDPPPSMANGLYPYTAFGDINNPSTLTLAPAGTPLWDTSHLNFSPRLGAAYQLRTNPGWETVVRAGGGVFYDTDNEAATLGISGVGFLGSYVLPAQTSFPVTAAMINAAQPGIATPYKTIYMYPRHLQLPYTLEWNLSAQQSLGKSQTLTVSYIGAAGRRLLDWKEYSKLNTLNFNPNFTTVWYLRNGVTSDYDALQLSFQRNLHHGLQALASYSWSHTIDNGADLGTLTSYSSNLPTKRGNADNDLRHNLSAGVSWNLPNVQGNQIVRQALSHWGVDGRLFARTGFPVNIQGPMETDASTGATYYSGVSLTGQPLYLYGAACNAQFATANGGRPCPGGRAINPAAFTDLRSATNNPAPRNIARGFGENQVNLAARREFPLWRESNSNFALNLSMC